MKRSDCSKEHNFAVNICVFLCHSCFADLNIVVLEPGMLLLLQAIPAEFVDRGGTFLCILCRDPLEAVGPERDRRWHQGLPRRGNHGEETFSSSSPPQFSATEEKLFKMWPLSAEALSPGRAPTKDFFLLKRNKFGRSKCRDRQIGNVFFSVPPGQEETKCLHRKEMFPSSDGGKLQSSSSPKKKKKYGSFC